MGRLIYLISTVNIILLIFFAILLHSSLLFDDNYGGEISYNRLHPLDTNEIQQCLSPDLEEKEKSQCRFFAAVIDAGSTGTRLHLFEFSHDTEKELSTFKLEAETYKEVKPGVSCYAKTPELAAESVRHLLIVAKKQIPEDLWTKTPITFKATAGVRLLAEKEADALLSHIEAEILESGFLVDDDAVGVLSGTDEGVFGWFTLNFLLGQLDDALEKNKAAVALDLGGGSTQVTFVPRNFSAALNGLSRQKYSHRLKIFDKELRLYTHSYLGNGLVASRLGVAKLSSPEWIVGGPPTLRTHCLPKKFVLDDWDYAGNVWLISATPDASYEACLETTKQYVTNLTEIKRVPELTQDDQQLYLFGYYYDRGVQANVVEYTLEQVGGEAKVADFRSAAERACSIPAEAIGPEHWQPWQCLDLTYIYTLLHYGYGLPEDKSINLVKKVRSMEASWALGAGFHLLNTYHENDVKERKEQRQRELRAALERDRQELEARRLAVEEKEALAAQQMAALSGNDLLGLGTMPEQKLRTIVSFLTRIMNWVSGWTTHILAALNLIS